MSVASFKICTKLSMASRPSRGTVTIDRKSNLFSVRELRRRKTFTVPLDDVASMVVRGLILTELRQKQAAKKKAKRKSF